MTKRCSINGCDQPSFTRGQCKYHYNHNRTRQIVYGRWESGHVDAHPVRQHILALREKGIGNNRLCEITGVSHNTIQVIITGRPERGSGPSKKVMRQTAEKILAVPIPKYAFHAARNGRIVPALGTTRRLQALVAIGYNQRDLMRQLDWAWEGNHLNLFHGRIDSVSARKARDVAGLFAELAMTPGPSSRARNRGVKLGWAPPLAWDDIDDPNETPELGGHDGMDTQLKIAEFERLIRWGEIPETAAQRLGWTWSTTRTTYARHGRHLAWCKRGHPQPDEPTPGRQCLDCVASGKVAS
ncbi:hypothetical protein L5I01_17400 [Gordonia sp. HY442]|uniref:hypothetical protein n=1 Tax=Gordonia zhenghanii TaxID=2911516 RepID=UPI001F3D7F94|nr:hypothetical protein [Gordonia zhenghanii]MCF8605133.1 hypothetical protein [Gordonia zhenghanii]